MHELFPAEHRALRELHGAARQLQRHWARLAERLDGPESELLLEGAEAAQDLLVQLRDRVPVQGQPAAQGLGARLAGARGLSDLLLERNQAFRAALLDVQHVATLLDYAAQLATTRDDLPLAEWHTGWARRFDALAGRGRAAAAAMGADPEAAIAPADAGTLGHTGARLGAAVGTFGEAFDNSRLGSLVRRRPT